MEIKRGELEALAENLLARQGLKVKDRLTGGKLSFVAEDKDDNGNDVIRFIEVAKVTEFADISSMTRSEFEDESRAYLEKHDLDANIALDTFQFIVVGSQANVRRFQNQTTFMGGDEEEQLIKQLIAMTLIAGQNTDKQTNMVKGLRARLEEIRSAR